MSGAGYLKVCRIVYFGGMQLQHAWWGLWSFQCDTMAESISYVQEQSAIASSFSGSSARFYVMGLVWWWCMARILLHACFSHPLCTCMLYVSLALTDAPLWYCPYKSSHACVSYVNMEHTLNATVVAFTKANLFGLVTWINPCRKLD